jgi:hypothetical protein
VKETPSEQMQENDFRTEIPGIIAAARTGDYPDTSRRINIFLQHLQYELSKGYLPSESIAKITYSLETLLAMQQMNDWVAFADVLEYEFLPLWKSLSIHAKNS